MHLQFQKKLNQFYYTCQEKLNDIMPTRKETFSTIAIMKILTLRLTNSIGNYENHYLQAMDSHGRAFVQKYIYIYLFILYQIYILCQHMRIIFLK